MDMEFEWGNSLLHVAAQRGKPKIVQLILDYHGDIKAGNRYGETPFYTACEEGRLE